MKLKKNLKKIRKKGIEKRENFQHYFCVQKLRKSYEKRSQLPIRDEKNRYYFCVLSSSSSFKTSENSILFTNFTSLSNFSTLGSFSFIIISNI